MEVSAKLNYLRIAPRKVRLLADLIRGKKVKEAQTALNFAVKKGSLPMLKLLNQAVANAKNNFQLDSDSLFIYRIIVNEGPKLKRWRPRARGQAYEIQKKTSHIAIVLKSFKKVKKAKTKAIAKDKQSFQRPEEKNKKTEKIKTEKPKPELKTVKPKSEKGIKRIFRRKAF